MKSTTAQSNTASSKCRDPVEVDLSHKDFSFSHKFPDVYGQTTSVNFSRATRGLKPDEEAPTALSKAGEYRDYGFGGDKGFSLPDPEKSENFTVLADPAPDGSVLVHEYAWDVKRNRDEAASSIAPMDHSMNYTIQRRPKGVVCRSRAVYFNPESTKNGSEVDTENDETDSGSQKRVEPEQDTNASNADYSQWGKRAMGAISSIFSGKKD